MGHSLAEGLASIMAESAVCSGAVSSGQKVLAYNVALLLAGWRTGPERGTH